uniref:Ribosomal protein L34e n=1 Tax=Arcella intermedia TaxID=1963864 RepID=A0A6B2LQ46_9EUKA
MVQRVTYRRKHSYNTPSNKVKVVKTPGGRYTVHYIKKIATGPRCGDCGGKIFGIAKLRPIEYSRLPKSQRSVTRTYGGSRCANCTKNRIIRAFLIEEQKIVKSVLKRQEATKEKEPKVATKGKGKDKGKEKAKDTKPAKKETKAQKK